MHRDIGDARAGRALQSWLSVLSVGAICSWRSRRSLWTDLASASALIEQAANDLREQIRAKQELAIGAVINFSFRDRLAIDVAVNGRQHDAVAGCAIRTRFEGIVENIRAIRLRDIYHRDSARHGIAVADIGHVELRAIVRKNDFFRLNSYWRCGADNIWLSEFNRVFIDDLNVTVVRTGGGVFLQHINPPTTERHLQVERRITEVRHRTSNLRRGCGSCGWNGNQAQCFISRVEHGNGVAVRRVGDSNCRRRSSIKPCIYRGYADESESAMALTVQSPELAT